MAEESQDGQEKTEEPSQRKIEKAREDGKVLTSKEMFVFTSISAALVTMLAFFLVARHYLFEWADLFVFEGDGRLDDLAAINIGSLGMNDTGKPIVFDGSSAGFILSSTVPISMSGTTTDGLLTRHSASTATVESALTFDGSTLVLDGEARITEYLKHNGDLDSCIQILKNK